jgi:2'-5' RNA ligase
MDMNMPTESALVILIPEAEVLVESYRNQYDPSAAVGMPAHVTVLYPFKPPVELTADVIQSLEKLFSKFPGFSASFIELRRFPGVLYLPPIPDENFRRLTKILTKRFPETPPYGGQFTDIIPHLTVAQISESWRLDEIAGDFARMTKGNLPIRASVREIALMDNESGCWQVRTRFALGLDTAAS